MTTFFNTNFVKSVKNDVEETRTVEFIINTETKDRQKDVLNYDNWNLANYNANPIVGYQHNVYGDNLCTPPNPDDVLGKGNARIENIEGKRALVSTVTFEPKELNPTAEKVFRKVLFGSLRAASVGIMPLGNINTEFTRNEKDEVIDRTNFWSGQELLEWSIVNIPANQEAVRRSMKNHTLAALDYVGRILDDFSKKDLRLMTVQQILDEIEKRYNGVPTEQLELTLSLPGPDPKANIFLNKLLKLKKR